MHTPVSLAALAVALPQVSAWGNLGHETVGYVAMHYLTSTTLSWVQTSLGSTYNKSLGVAATWADTVKYTTAYEWSADYHFVDAEDSPLSGSCSVEEVRDCADNDCILAAIANYTTQLVDTSLSASRRQVALLFLDHFFGDISQPLHVEAYEVGGNDIDVKCDGYTDNLHSVWDTYMLEDNIDDNFSSSVTTYANSLISRIASDNFTVAVSEWLECDSTTEPYTDVATDGVSTSAIKRDITRALNARANSTITPLACPLVWAREANAFDCSVVFNYTSGQDLCGSTSTYYKKAIPVIDLQLARSGYRLAAWLNALLDP